MSTTFVQCFEKDGETIHARPNLRIGHNLFVLTRNGYNNR